MNLPYTKAGKCGNTVWQRNRYGQISYPYFIPANPRTPAQLEIRASFGSVSARWRTLTEAQRQLWCAAGKTKKTRRRLGLRWPLPGFNYFVKVNVALAQQGHAQTDVPPLDFPPPGAPVPMPLPAFVPQVQPLASNSPQAPPKSAGSAPLSIG